MASIQMQNYVISLICYVFIFTFTRYHKYIQNQTSSIYLLDIWSVLDLPDLLYWISTLWLYKLILKHLLKYCTKFHYIDFVWPLIPSSLMDIWYLVSNKQVICKKCWEMASRKKVRFFGLAQIYLFLMDKFLKKRNVWHKKVFIIGLKGNKWMQW